jgi:beta-galactosidase
MTHVNRRRFLQESLTTAAGSVLCGATDANAVPGTAPAYAVVWDLATAHREATPTRERVCINGIWRWQPGSTTAVTIPSDGWGHFRVPDSWPGGKQRFAGPQLYYPNPRWKELDVSGVTAAWHQREITIPPGWTGRRVALYVEYLNSYAAVYVDGTRVGELHYPWGEVDLTAVCHPGKKYLLSMLVVAMPLNALMLAYNNTASAQRVVGKVVRRGLCGDAYVVGVPAGPRITDVKVETSVRRWQIAFDTALAAINPGASYILRARISDGSRQVAEIRSEPFESRELANGRISITENWRPEKLWDTHTPQNQYQVSVSLLDTSGKLLDTALPIRFGFREFWIEGRDFYLNGTRIYLQAVPLNNGQGGTTMASYEATRATLQRFKSFGVNFVYTHNYSCVPGAHRSFHEVLKAADDEGVLLSFTQPHFADYDWIAPDADTTNGYAQHAEFYVRMAQNHPAVVCYSTSHNACGYSEDMNPDMLDGIQNPRDRWSLRNAGRALRAEAILHRLDSSRIVYHHAGGNIGSMDTINFYVNWAPSQEMCDWFGYWATVAVKPVFTCEYSVPFPWDWSMYRGWYKSKRAFGNAVAPWEFCVAEWDAQFLGPRSYQIIEAEKENLRWEAEQFRLGRVWGRNDYPYTLDSQVFEDRFKVIAAYVTDNFRAFRTWGVSGTSPWIYDFYWKHPTPERGIDNLQLAIDWNHLQRPSLQPAYVREDEMQAQLAFHPSDYVPTVAARALVRNYMPLLAYIAGAKTAFTSKDHHFFSGETTEKQLILINNSRLEVAADCAWSFDLPRPVTGSAKVPLPPGEQNRIPLRLELPADLAPGRYQLHATVSFSSGETQKDSFSIDVLARPPGLQASANVALFDPKGETAKLLSGMGVHVEGIEAKSNLSSYDTLIIGKGALTLEGVAPDVARVRDGLKVIIFEQTGEVLEKRFGFRVADYGMRWIFKRVPDHPLLAGIEDEHLRNWRGESTILPSRLTYQRTARFNYAPQVEWAGIPVTRVWRCGNRGNVASALIEKPARGDFLPILDGGYALQYSSLVEYHTGKGMVLFCQTDVSGRTETDPAAETLARNILNYATTWKPGPCRTVVYTGDPAGLTHLRLAGFQPAAYDGGNLTPDQVLVVGPGGGQQLARNAKIIAGWVTSGGHLLAIGLDGNEANSFLPFKVATVKWEHIAAYFDTFGTGSLFAGVSPAEVHNRDPRDFYLVSTGAMVVGDGVLATVEGTNVVFCQLAPWQFDYTGGQMNVKRTYRRVSCLTARLLANMGAESETPLLPHITKPVTGNEKRWLNGLYLDTPEEWDDPYRFFGW